MGAFSICRWTNWMWNHEYNPQHSVIWTHDPCTVEFTYESIVGSKVYRYVCVIPSYGIDGHVQDGIDILVGDWTKVNSSALSIREVWARLPKGKFLFLAYNLKYKVITVTTLMLTLYKYYGSTTTIERVWIWTITRIDMRSFYPDYPNYYGKTSEVINKRS